MKNILIADDNKDITDILAAYVKKEGYHPVIAKDGGEAERLFESENPVALLLDVMMPVKDGYEVCKDIRKRSSVPIILITARGEDFDKIMGLDIGADLLKYSMKLKYLLKCLCFQRHSRMPM